MKVSRSGVFLATLPAIAGIACDAGTTINSDAIEDESPIGEVERASSGGQAWEPSGPTVTLDFDGSVARKTPLRETFTVAD